MNLAALDCVFEGFMSKRRTLSVTVHTGMRRHHQSIVGVIVSDSSGISMVYAGKA